MGEHQRLVLFPFGIFCHHLSGLFQNPPFNGFAIIVERIQILRQLCGTLGVFGCQ